GIVMTEPNVLAYNFFPDNGDMVINLGHNWGVSSNDYRFLRNVLGHEHGHGMGLGHVIPMNETKLMEPVLATNFDGPQNDDIQGCQFLYGDAVEDNDDAAHATDVGMVSSGQSVELLAVERPSDRDWFRVEIPEGFNLTIRVEPVGETYMVGPQGGSPALRNSRAINNLRLSAYLLDGTTLLGSSNSGGVGFPETLQSIARPANGIVNIKVDVSTIAEDIQRYRLVFLLDGATTTFSPNGYFLVSGNEIGGGLFGLQFSDDFRLKLYPRAASQQQRAYIDFEVLTTSTILNPTSMIVGYEGSASSTNVFRRIYAYDYVAGAYVQINQAQSNTIEATFEFNVANPARFVNAGGQMKVRVYNIANGPIFAFPYETATDWVYWRLTQ
ncbi:MAG: matrixin family metalloprotease, partial [Fimbriimonadales bacterium]